MIRTILFLSFCFIFFTNFSQNKPDWVIKHPLDSDYYLGIAFCEKNNPSYIGCAKYKALESIASEIMIKVSSETQLLTKERMNSFESSFSSNIKTQTTSELEGYELMDVWQDNRFYWVYYRLNKNIYSSLLNNKVLSELTIAKQFFDSGLKYFIEKEFTSSLSSFIQANIYIQSNLSRPNVSEHTSNSWQLFEQSKEHIINLLSRINLLAEENEINISYTKPDVVPLKLNAVYSDLNNINYPIQNMPFKFSFEKGCGVVQDTIVYSNNEGVLTNSLLKINSPELKQILVCEVSTEKLIPNLQKMSFVQNVTKGNTPKIRFNINVVKALVYINTIELNHKISIKPKIIEPILINYLKSNGFNISTDSQNFDYSVSVNANTRKGNQINGICTSFLDVELILKDKNNNIIFSSSKNGLKGLKLNYYDAGLDSYRRNIELLEKEFFNEIMIKLSKE